MLKLSVISCDIRGPTSGPIACEIWNCKDHRPTKHGSPAMKVGHVLLCAQRSNSCHETEQGKTLVPNTMRFVLHSHLIEVALHGEQANSINYSYLCVCILPSSKLRSSISNITGPKHPENNKPLQVNHILPHLF